MSHRRVASLLALLLVGAGLPLACSPSPAAPPPAVVAPPPPASSAPGEAASSASAAPSAPPAPPPAPAASEPPPPLCIDGEILMGACICSKGKGVDATGHCVFMPCPKGTYGGDVFRDPQTGQCMECKPGSKATPDGKCLK